MSGLSKYISFRGHGEASVQLPIDIQDATLYAFALKSKQSEVQAFVDSMLNAVAPGVFEYQVILNHVLLAFMHCAKGTSGGEVIGYEEDNESALFIPLIQRKPHATVPKFRMWVPYLLIDSALGMTTGREVLGYNKTYGTTKIPLTGAPAEFVGSTVIFKTLSQQTKGSMEPLIVARRKDGGPMPHLLSQWSSPVEMVDSLASHLGGAVEALGLRRLLPNPYVPLINVKQIRDIEYDNLACYQALAECECQIQRLHGGGLIRERFEVSITDCESHQIVKDLGLGQSTLPVSLGFWAKIDFTNPAGRTVWQAP